MQNPTQNTTQTPPVMKDSLTMLRELMVLYEAEATFDASVRHLDTPDELKQELKQLMKMNVWLTQMFINILESVERPDGTKFLGSARQMTGGQRKKAVLDLVNYLLERNNMPPCPGALGEVIYNDLLCFPYLYRDY